MHLKFLITVCCLFATCMAQGKEYVYCKDSSLNLNNIFAYFYQIDKLSDENEINTPVDEQIADLRGKSYEAVFLQCMASVLDKAAIIKMDATILHRTFSAVRKVSFYSANRQSVSLMKMIIDEKKSRGESVSGILPKLHSAYVRTRQFDKAKVLVTEYPSIKFSALPQVKHDKSASRSLYTVNDQATKIEQTAFNFPKGGHAVVVSAPICSPCKRLFSWLQTRPKLKKVMTEQATWITPVVGELYLEEMRETNDTYAPIRLQYTYSQKQWPEIEYWATPTFYFYQDGELVKQMSGWPKKGREQALLSGLKAVGLL
jgi:hypothetical protein